jgi:hypothetical protein
MKPGDLILYYDHHRTIKEKFFGIYISSRITKWSKTHAFYRILEIGGGIDEFILNIDHEHKVEVIQNVEPKTR